MSFVYDALGRVTSETRVIDGESYTTAHAWDASGRLSSLTYPSGRIVNYTRDTEGRITAVKTKEDAGASACSEQPFERDLPHTA